MLTVPSSLSNLLAHLISYSFSFICLAENLPSLLPGLSTLTPGTLQNTWFFLGLVLLQVHYRVHGFFRTRFTLGTQQSTWFFRTRFTPGALQSTWFIQDQVYSRYTVEYMVFLGLGSLQVHYRVHGFSGLVLIQVHQSTCFFRTSFTPVTLQSTCFLGLGLLQVRQSTCFFSGQVLLRVDQRTHGFFQDQVYSRNTRVHMVLFRTRFTPGTLEYMFFCRTSYNSGYRYTRVHDLIRTNLQVHQRTCFFQDQVYSWYTRVHGFHSVLVLQQIRFTPGTLKYMFFQVYSRYTKVQI